MKKIILTNQHVDNRGDESAIIGAIKSLRYYFGLETQITIYLQSGTKQKFLSRDWNVNEKPMIINPLGILEMLIWIILKLIRVDIRNFSSAKLKDFIKDHETADIVISSCGGPYIGDIYINHEYLHIMHLALPLFLKIKTVFFAVSMGPFKNKFMNYFRKKLFQKIGLLILRDSISFDFVKEFVPENKNIYLTTDACLADELNLNKTLKKSNVIGITPLDYKYPLAENAMALKLNYEKTIVGVLDELTNQNPELKVEFFPQLYAKHSDVPFIQKIISKMKFPERTFIFSDQLSGREQQIEIASLEYMIANRYHSAIFACKTNTPVVCIVYEHKAKAFMESVNLGDYCIDIYNLEKQQLLEMVYLLQKNTKIIKEKLPMVMKEMNKLSNKTSELIYDYSVEN